MGLFGLFLAAILLAVSSPGAQAQQLPGYNHRHWDAEQGAPPDITVIAQTRDGFLWLGTSTGLYRFDGLTFERVEPTTYSRRRSSQVTALAAANDGALWVGYAYGGIGVYRNGRLDDANGAVKPSGAVFKIAVDREGTPWVAVNGALGPQIKRMRNGRWEVHGTSDWLRGEAIHDVFIARDGTLWIAQARSILRLRPGQTRPDKVADVPVFTSTIAEDDRGEIWVTTARGLQRMTGSPVSIPIATKGLRTGLFSQSSLVLEDGVAWISGYQEGLIQIPYRQAGTQEIVPLGSRFLFRDREGTIWGGGSDGLVNYVPSPVMRLSLEGNPATGFASGGGSGNPLYVATDAGVYRLDAGPPTMILKASAVTALCAGPADSLLVVTAHGDYLRQSGVWSRFGEPFDGFSAGSCAIGRDGRMWSAIGNQGIFRLENRRWNPVKEWQGGQFIATDGSSGLYANQVFQAILHLKPGSERPIWSGDAIAVGFVKLIKLIGAHTYIGGEKGLARYDGEQIITLEARHHPWLNGVTGVTISSSDAWLLTNAGIVRVTLADFNRAFQAPGKPIDHQIFGTAQGIQSRSTAYWAANDAELDPSGRPWFVTNRGVFRIDPARSRPNLVPPPVNIRSVSANGIFYPNGDISLPAGTTRVQLDYVALSLTDPVSNVYRYRLDGVDDSWIDAGAKRQASYTGLGPGHYEFHVIAANPDGIWNRAGAVVKITIAPYFWQTWWFKAALFLICAVLLWAFVHWRIRAAAEVARHRIEDRLAVREHIAQDLHDTLLQGVQGLVLRFQSTVERLPPGNPIRVELESTLDRADDVLQEGRDRVRFLREETVPVDLATMLSEIAEDVLQKELRWSIKQTGVARPVCAPVGDEIARIANEAIFNALRHAHASLISIRISHRPDGVSICIGDNGVGLDNDVKSSGGKVGHYGLVGMRERAQRLGATLRISDAEPSGTEIRLTVPARIAYR